MESKPLCDADDETFMHADAWLRVVEKAAGALASPAVIDMVVLAAGCYWRGVEEAFIGRGPEWGLDPYTSGDLQEWVLRQAVYLTIWPNAHNSLVQYGAGV